MPDVELLMIGLAVVAGLIGAASYVYAILVRATPMRAMNQLALCCNLCAAILMAIGLGLNSKSHMIFALGFVVVGTLTLSRAAVRRRQERRAA